MRFSGAEQQITWIKASRRWQLGPLPQGEVIWLALLREISSRLPNMPKALPLEIKTTTVVDGFCSFGAGKRVQAEDNECKREHRINNIHQRVHKISCDGPSRSESAITIELERKPACNHDNVMSCYHVKPGVSLV